MLSHPGTSAQGLPDTLQLPFTEDWSSGSFTTSHWSFPEGQGNWAIENSYGNPSPSATFQGYPTLTYYSYKLYSTWVDGKQFQCSYIWLDFDLKLNNISITRTEQMTVGKEYDTTWIPLCTIKNDSSMGWKHYHLYTGFANKHYFNIGFIASGVNSSAIDAWYIDNIHLDYVCQPPSQLVESTGMYGDTVFLSWTPPVCEMPGTMIDLIYDDGTAENGWMITPGYTGWLGNEFPVPGMSGTLQSFTSFWWLTACAPAAMTFDIFDADRNYVATTDTFWVGYSDWVTVPVNNVPFNGTFYVMAHWIPTSNCHFYLGDDENGPYASQDLAWYSDGTIWQKVSTWPSVSPSVFILRATAFVNDYMKTTELLPAIRIPDLQEMNDSMVLEGYNIYRKSTNNGSSFTRINANPVTVTQFYDTTVDADTTGYYYYVTSVYNLASTNNFLCESAGTDTVFASWYVGMGEKKNSARLKVFPVPAKTVINIQSDKIITGIEIDDHLGCIRMAEGNLRENEYSIPVDKFSPGLYFLKVMTGEGIITRKILVLH